LKYLLAAALIDGEVGPDQLQTERIRRSDVQELLNRINIQPDAALTARYPRATPVRITIKLRDGQHLSREQDDYEGARSRPFTWERTVEKFHRLALPYADDGLRAELIDTVDHLDSGPISVLTNLITKFSPEV
jgi:2-methylcitrate dehydratase